MTALLLVAMMQVVPQDTIRTEFVIPLPRQEVVRDTTPIIVNVEAQVPDSIMQAVYRAGAADARAAAEAACACADSGPPDWFWAGLLALGTYGIYVWSKKDGDDVDIDVSSESNADGGDGGDGGGHHHPPGHHKGKPHG